MPRLTDKVAFIPGATSGIGRATATYQLGPGQPNHIANMALCLASDESEITTGRIIHVDSGVTIS